MTDLSDIPASDLLAMFRTRQTSPAEVWADIERRIAAWEPSIAALWAYDPESARADAAAATERWAKGAPKGPLDGVPVTIKELIATKGTPVPNGTAATTLVPAPEDAPPAARLREDGAIIFAKTTCPDYGMLSSGLSSFHKLSRNPWDIRLNPGGSSAGAAAAAAAGLG
ncbi:MAG TPA: amidase, partial [Aurantimonas coralicida]|nr:amidase [Aurantimonas coralicida]